MRCYKKPFSWEVVRDESASVFGWKPETEWLYFVHVCSFRFSFVSVSQIAEYRDFYAQPLKPSFRYVDTANGEYSRWKDPTLRSQMHKLPLYLWQKGKRERVVAALDKAIREFSRGTK